MNNHVYLLTNLSPQYRAALKTTEDVIRVHSKTFYFATGLLPLSQRHAIRSLYAFCRASDDLVDTATTTLHDLNLWRDEVNLSSDHQNNPLLVSWAVVREHYKVDRTFERELLDGIQMDLEQASYPTWQALEQYCYRVASTVGLLSMPIIGAARGATLEEAAPFAIKLGIALQLTNILRDVGEDASRGRVYIPEEDLARFHLTSQDIRSHVYNQNFIDLMHFEIERARTLYRESLPGITLLNPSARPAVGAAALLYAAILDEIEKINYRVHEIRAHTSSLKKVLMLPGILLRVYTLARPRKV